MKSYCRISFLVLFSLYSMLSFALPAGSYLDSCRRCHEVDNKVSCICDTNDGIANRTELSYLNCNTEKYNVINQNGNLVCGERKHDFGHCYDCHHHRHHYDDKPYGSYRNSCVDCSLDGKQLYCSCYDNRQYLKETSINVHHCYKYGLDIMNDNGRLTCGRPVTDRNAVNAIQLFLRIG